VSLFQKYFEGDLAELRRLLGLCGIKVNCALCADGSREQVRNLSSAALNVVVHPEYGLETARFLEGLHGTPVYVCDGPPIGFAATEGFVRDLCAALGTDPSKVIEESERARARAYVYLSRVHSLTGLPKGVRVAAEGTYAGLLAYFSFFVDYFGMIPDAAAVLCPDRDAFRGRLESFLGSRGLQEALGRDILDSEGELVFASGATISRLRMAKRRFVGIENALPALGYLDVTPKTHLGIKGALLLVEQVLNGLAY
jgi:nitrogenase molybdenum-iron protein alpha/beta subunit